MKGSELWMWAIGYTVSMLTIVTVLLWGIALLMEVIHNA